MGIQKERARFSAEENRAPDINACDDTTPIGIAPAAVKIRLLLADIGASIGPLECQLACLAAHVAAGDSTGVVYALRRLKAHWRCLDLDARDLIAADAERLSAIRQQAGDAP
jgi:hypothetical protein